MKSNYYFYIGLLLYLLSFFSPIAVLNDKPITILPVFNNFSLLEGFYSWKDIAIFSITYIITFALFIIFKFRKKIMAIKFTLAVSVFSLIIIVLALFRIYQNSIGFNSIKFQFYYGIPLAFLALISLFVSTKSIVKHE